MQQENKSYFWRKIEDQFKNILNKRIKKAIGKCIKCKQISFSRFIITKLQFKEINHRKIVQKIFSNYIPEKQEIQLDCQILDQYEYKSKLNIKGLVLGIKQLPNNLQIITMDFQKSNIGEITENIKYLVECMKNIPRNLKNLKLNLQENCLGGNAENLQWLGEGMKQLPQSLKSFYLNLCSNKLEGNYENLKLLKKGLKQLPLKLQNLELNLSHNYFGENGQNQKYLGSCIKQFPNNLVSLSLNLTCCELRKNNGEDINIQGKGQGINLQSLKVELQINYLGNKVENMYFLGQGMKQLPRNLKSFRYEDND